MTPPAPIQPDTCSDQSMASDGTAGDPDTELLVALCRRWEAARLTGTPIPPADLCGERSDLLPDLLRAIEVLGVMDKASTADALDGAGPAEGGPPPPPRLPGYELLGEVGRGGMGVVYTARHLALDRVVAVKLIADPDLASAARLARFRQEAEAVARLQHPNIVQIFETGVADGRPYLTLEYVPGGTLGQRTAGVPQPPRDAARLVETVARAVHHAHERRIVHRDLKPHNILLTPAGVPKVTDFGLARPLDAADRATRTGDFLGTPAYAAPEQVLGRAADVGPAADVYALGVTLYELLAGRVPFAAESVGELLRQVTDGEPTPLRRLRSDCPRDLETICLMCLRKEPARRYPSAAALADDLRRFQADESVLARPVGRLGRGMRWARRNPAVAGLLTAVGLLLGAAAAGGAVLAAARASALAAAVRDRDRATDSERDARTAERQARDHLAAAHAAAARLALQRGNGRAALGQLDAAAAVGLDPPALRLERVKALCTVHDIPRAIAEVRRLAGRTDLGDLAGEVLLWQADLEMDHGTLAAADGLEQVRRALDRGLSAADAHYARGLLAATTLDALGHFRQAVDADPAGPRANGMLITLLTVSGRFPEARDRLRSAGVLFPDNPVFRVLHAMLDALTGRPEEAGEHLRLARGQLGAGAFATAGSVVGLCRELPRLGRELEKVQCGDPTADARAAFGAFTAALGEARALLGDPAGDLFLPAPPVFHTAFRTAVRDLPAALSVFATLNPDAAAATLERLAAVHPDGFLYLLSGVLLGGKDTPDHWVRAERAFLRAADTPSLVPVRRPALFGAAVAAWSLSLDGPPQARPGRRSEAAGRLPAVLDLGVLAEQGHTLTVMAIGLAAPPDLAWKAVAAWERAAPDDPRLPWQRARLHLQTGAYGRAARLADEALSKDADAANWRELRKTAGERLRQQADQFPPPPGDGKGS